MAEAQHAMGELERMLLLPDVFGGDDRPENVVYVPAGFGAIRDETWTNVVIQLAQAGDVDEISVIPEYKGSSLVPTRIRLRAWHSEKSGRLDSTLEVW
jgi:hypothetical protein